MKKYIFLIVLIVISIFSINNIYAKKEYNLIGKVIVIDPGHGALDPGTIYGDIYEKDITLKISNFLKENLEKEGAIVLMTRAGDYDLSKPNASFRKKSDFDNRIELINSSKADLYLSIHLNYLNDSNYSGPQVFYVEDNKDIASIMQNTLNKFTKSNRKIKIIPNSIYMYNKLKIKGILIECGFLSNKKERELLINNTYQNKVASIIVNGLKMYFT